MYSTAASHAVEGEVLAHLPDLIAPILLADLADLQQNTLVSTECPCGQGNRIWPRGNLIWPILGALAYWITSAYMAAPKLMHCMQRMLILSIL